MNAMIYRRKQVLQVRKTSSISGTYLCSMQGGACGRWTLREMFPSRYNVSSCKGYKLGFAWLRMQKLLRKIVYNTKWELTIGSILQARAWDVITTWRQKISFFIILVYLVWKMDKLVPNICPFKSNLRVWKRQVHSTIFSLFENELEKSLNKTHDISSPI